MNHNKIYTPDEKMELVTKYLSSGKSLRTWCQEHQLSKSTFYGWIKKYDKTKCKTINNDSTFIEFKCSEIVAKQKDDSSIVNTCSFVSLEYKGFKLT